MRALLVLGLAAIGLATPGRISADQDVRAQAARAIADKLAVIERTDAALVRTIERRRDHLEARARALYKAERAGRVRPWVDAEERERLAWRRLIARRMISREAREIDLLTYEREAMVRARVAIIASLGDVATAVLPEPASLAPPVHGGVRARFGRVRDRDTETWLTRRGVELEAARGEDVVAVEAGEVIYAGALRNLGRAVIVDHAGELRSVITGFEDTEVRTGDRVARGQRLGGARAETIYLELRLPIGPEGVPIDPEPYLAPADR